MSEESFRNGSIILEQLAYYPGQIFNGSVEFHLREPLNFNGLYIQYHGEANVLWTYTEIEKIHGIERQREVKYQGHEEYFNYTETLAGGNGTTQLPPRSYTFPFSFQIPFNCPSTFKGQKGSVSYSVTATLMYTDMRREEIIKVFTIVAPLDLNTGSPRIKEPIDLELEELNPCSFCCGSDSVTVRFRLPVTGYCPGQNIPVAVEVQNESSVEITKMIFEITTSELYRSQQPPSEYVVPGNTLSSTERGPVLAGCKKSFTCEVPVPDMIVPYLENCGIIDVGYFFKVTVLLSGCNDDMYDESEICLGLVPLWETVTTEYKHPMADSLPPGPIPTNDQPAQLPSPPNVPFHNSHQSLNRSQNNINNDPPPYPGNAPYPSENKNEIELGFRTPQRLSAADMPYPNPQYPASNILPGASPPPYPITPPGGSVPPYPGYPQVNNSGSTPYGGGFAPSAPSAPPATD